MNSRLAVLSLILLSFCVAGCDGRKIRISQGGEQIDGSGTIRTEPRAVAPFTAVSLGGAGRVEIERGETDSVTISSDDNVLPKITAETRNGVLTLGIASRTSIVANELVYRVTVRDLQVIDASGAEDIRASNLASKALTVNIAGSSAMKLSGNAANFWLTISGSGTVEAAGLMAERTNVVISGSGNASVHARESLNAVISGSGKVTYSGTPKLHKTISGTGSLRSAS